MSALNNIQRRLAEGTASWLWFEFQCQRGDLFSEKQLVMPVGQILSGAREGRIKVEVSHPVLIKRGQGRPLQLDFVLTNKDEWKFAVETKWVTDTMISLASIIWDLIRLELVVYEKKCEAYFVLAGFSKKIKEVLKKTHFINLKSKSKTLITTKNKVNISLSLVNLPAPIKNYINNKLSEFPGVKVPKTMYFEFPHSYPEKKINMTFETIVWKVNSLKSKERVASI